MSRDKKPQHRMTDIRYREIDGLKIRYAKGHDAPGRSILLLSPWPESIYAYLPTWDLLSSLGPVIAVDLPGFGHSESRPDVMSPEAMGEFILRVLGAFELERPHAIGPDVGTPSLLFAAFNRPERFESLIIGGGATDASDTGGILKELVYAPTLEPYRKMTGEEFVRGATNDMKIYTPPEVALRDYIRSYEGPRLLESVQFVRHYPRALPRLQLMLSQIDVPCQIIVGRHDPFVPVSNAIRLHSGLPRSKLDILDCGHFAWEDANVQYGNLAAEWIGGGYSEI
jgi:pimeloyl-ACP methyl ester carboxylesterase